MFFLTPLIFLFTTSEASSKYYFGTVCKTNETCVLNTYPIYSNIETCNLKLSFSVEVDASVDAIIQNNQYNLTLQNTSGIVFNNFNCSNNLTLIFPNTQSNVNVKVAVETDTINCWSDIKCLVLISQIFAVLFTIFC